LVIHVLFFLFSMLQPPPRSPLFPYTTLFRSTPSTPRSSSRRLDPRIPPSSPSAASSSPGTSTRGPRTSASSSCARAPTPGRAGRSEEHTSELQSRFDLVCRLLLEKKKKHQTQ